VKRALINCRNGVSVGNALSKLESNIRSLHKDRHKELLFDFDDAEANGFMQAFGKQITNII